MSHEVGNDKEPLNIIARKIAEHSNQFEKSSDHVIRAARYFKEARERIEAGEDGEITWFAWAMTNINLSPSRLRELQTIAEAENPDKEVKRLRELNRRRVQKYRKRKEIERKLLEKPRRCVIEWAKSADLAQVENIQRSIARLSHAADLRGSYLEGADHD